MSFGCSYILSDRIVQIFAIPLEDVYYRAQGAVLWSRERNFAPENSEFAPPREAGASGGLQGFDGVPRLREELQDWLMENRKPLLFEEEVPPFHLIFTELTEAFITNIYVSALVSFYFSAIPIIFYQF